MASTMSSVASQKPAQSARDWLDQDLNFGKLKQQTERLLAIQTVLLDHLRLPGLSVVKTEPGLVSFIVASPAQAAKLRQLEPEILQILASNGWHFSRIKVRPQTSFAPKRVHSPDLRDPIPATVVRFMRETAQEMSDGPLKQALLNIAQNSAEARS